MRTCHFGPQWARRLLTPGDVLAGRDAAKPGPKLGTVLTVESLISPWTLPARRLGRSRPRTHA